MTMLPVLPPVLGSSARDLAFLENKIAEWYRVYSGVYPYWVLRTLTDQTGLNVYGEVNYDAAVKQPAYENAAQVRLWVRLDPPQKTLDRFGLDSPQQALVTASQHTMRQLSIRPRTGDRFDFNDWQYEIKTVKEGGWFTNGKVAVEWVMTAERVNKRWPLQT